MRVLFSPDMFVKQNVGGITRYFSELHAGLKDGGVDARIFAGLHSNEYIGGNAAKHLRRIPSLPRLILSHGAFTAYAITQRDRAVIHPTYYTAHPVPGKFPHVCTFYDLIHVRFAPKDGIIDRQRFWARRSDKIIAISHATAEDLANLLHVPRHKIAVIHLGTHIPHQQPRRNPDDYLLYVGARDGYKNWSIVIDALRAPELSGLRLVCCGGRGPTSHEMKLLEDRGLRNRVDFVQADEETLDRLYRRAVALVYPSLYEGFGLPPLEAMARGVPVVASSASSIPEVVGDAALLFDPEDSDALVHAVSSLFDTATREVCEKRGLARARMFPWSRTVQQTIDVYRDVLS